FKGGYQENGRPVASETIVATTDDPTVAKRLAELLGGDIEELDVDRGDDHRIVTEATSVDLIVDGPAALSSRFALEARLAVESEPRGQRVGAVHEARLAVESEPRGRPRRAVLAVRSLRPGGPRVRHGRNQDHRGRGLHG